MIGPDAKRRLRALQQELMARPARHTQYDLEELRKDFIQLIDVLLEDQATHRHSEDGGFPVPDCHHCHQPCEKNSHGDWVCDNQTCFSYRS